MKLLQIKSIYWTGDACIGLACEDLKKDLKKTAGIDVTLDNACHVESRVITVGTMENKEYVALAKEYIENLPAAWEEYVVKILEDRIVVIGVDKRAAMWGIYHISRLLGVLPGSAMTESAPKPCLELAEGEYRDRPKSYKFRGWFLNDEDLLCKWHLGGGIRDHDYTFYHNIMDISTLVPIVETALRMGINLMIPASLLDIDDPRQEKLIAYCQSRGMYVSQHHIEPLGVSYWNYASYYRKQDKNIPFSFVTEKERAIECWKYYAKKWAKYGKDVIWQLGLRGKGDRPVWESDSSLSSRDLWGKVISEAIQTQCNIVKELVGEEFYSTMTLWSEGADLYIKGDLKIPKDTMIIFSDAGPTQMMSEDFYNIAREQNRNYGIYYHVAYMGSGPHLAVGNNPHKMLFNYSEALQCGDNTYSILNVSNVRELMISVAAGAELMWDKDQFNVDDFYARWCRDYLGSVEIADLMDSYFNCFMKATEEEMRRDCSFRYNIHYIETEFPYYTINDGRVRFMGRNALNGERITEWIERLKDSIGRFATFYEHASRYSTDPYCKYFLFQARYMMLLETWVLGCGLYAEDGDKEHLEKAADALRTYLEERKAFEKGMYENWYRGDEKMNFPLLLEMTEDRY